MVANILTKRKEKAITLEAYFKLEGVSLHKNEFHKGKIIPMPNASINHNEISGNIFGHLFMLSYQTNTFRVYNSDQKVYITENESVTYPDVFVVVGAIEKFNKFSITNPTVIFEVASESTFKYDRGKKFRKYQGLPTFQEYVLIDQDTPCVEVLFKTENGWMMEIYLGLEEVVQLQSINSEIKMSDIYKNVEGLHHPQGKIDLE